MVKIVKVLLELHWGYSIKHPIYSASQPSFRFPPPTTLIGALAYTIASRENRSEILIDKNNLYSYTAKILIDVPWATYRFLNIDPSLLTETRDLVRVSIAPYVRRDNIYPGSPYIWAVQTHGKMYIPLLLIEAIYVVKDSAVNNILRYAWGITRIGTKESIASVKSVEILDTYIVSDTIVETVYSFPKSLAEPIDRDYIVSRLPIIDREWYCIGTVRNIDMFLEDYVIPRTMVRARITERGVALGISNIGIAIIPKQVVGYG